MTYREAKSLLGKLKTARLHARQRREWDRAVELHQKVVLLKRKLKETRVSWQRVVN